MGSTLEHFSHPEHPLILKVDDVIEVAAAAKCYICDDPVTDYPAYYCPSHDDITCQSFYLHKKCAELPTRIHHHKHNQHPLDLLPRPETGGYFCDVCSRRVKFAYACDDCKFDVCVFCTSDQRMLHHEGHQEHTLILMNRKALFECDACGEEAKDSSYVCTTCEFWIHKRCAFAPSIIPSPSYHHHPLHLIYSIPEMHRYFRRYCNICHKRVCNSYWMYYCHKCTYFVHMNCATSTISMVNELEADGTDEQPDLVQFPLDNGESLFDLIITQCGKLQAEDENTLNMSTIPNDPHIIEKHWSHEEHPLELLQVMISENDEDDDGDEDDEGDEDRRVLICDACIQPITVSHPSYYACIKCGFFLHSFCATKLPRELPAGASSFHPGHSLSLYKSDRFYEYVECKVCTYSTNGFYYHCEDCDINIDIRCAFLPKRIIHKSHKHHSLVLSPFSNSMCSISSFWITEGMEYYACETCSSFRIHIVCIIYPSRLNHRYDRHPITLREPPFFYEGVFYCEICEEQVNNQRLLYHCEECDHSFHYDCVRWFENMKTGRTIKISIYDQPHTFTLVLKRTIRRNSPLYICRKCGDGYKRFYFYECDSCGFLFCFKCAREVIGSTS